MNKSFAYEYKKSAMEDTPDLWSRIEVGIDTNQPGAERVVTTSKKVIPFYKKYGGLLAACFCIFVLIPCVVVGIRINRSSLYSEDASGMEQSASESFYEEAPAVSDATEEPAQAPVEDMAPAQDTAEAAPAGEAQADSESEMNSSALMDGATIRDLQLIIEEIDTNSYAASVLEDPNGYFEAGELIRFKKDSYLELDFKIGDSYTATLNYYADEDIPLEVIQAEKNN